MTLATFALFRGLAFVISDAGAVSTFPSWFEAFGQWYAGPVPLQLFVFVIAAMAIGLVLARGRFGRYVRAIGYNREAARFSGVPIGRVTVAVYVLTGAAGGDRGDHLHLARVLRARRLRAGAGARRDRRGRARRRERPRRLGDDHWRPCSAC